MNRTTTIANLGLMAALALVATGCGTHTIPGATAVASKAAQAKAALPSLNGTKTILTAPQADTKAIWFGSCGGDSASLNLFGGSVQGQVGKNQISAQVFGNMITGWVRGADNAQTSIQLSFGPNSMSGFIGQNMASCQVFGGGSAVSMMGSVGTKRMAVYCTGFGCSGNLGDRSISLSGAPLHQGEAAGLSAFLLAALATSN